MSRDGHPPRSKHSHLRTWSPDRGEVVRKDVREPLNPCFELADVAKEVGELLAGFGVSVDVVDLVAQFVELDEQLEDRRRSPRSSRSKTRLALSMNCVTSSGRGFRPFSSWTCMFSGPALGGSSPGAARPGHRAVSDVCSRA